MYTRKYSRKPRRNEQKVRNLVVTIITSIDDEEKKKKKSYCVNLSTSIIVFVVFLFISMALFF